ncbi:unnamed protein product [Caenorhabditis auriculariae]|uniref:G-protein coupled receptors family 1 profile domain-containing protein n=1 Tax=Caenorhabditis auriculariae TaxID=2777116 RepID=A0A8S1HUS5_9PELO|nr:unnamed protein product [Caenorhabditis auriculariae]
MLQFRHYASIVMILVSLFGTASNLLAILVISKNSALKNSFGALCFSHCLANLGILAVFGAWAAPLNFFIDNGNEIPSIFINLRIGQICLFFYNISLLSHLCVSMNRFAFIIFPMKAPHLMGRRTTFWIIVVVWIISVLEVLPLNSG